MKRMFSTRRSHSFNHRKKESGSYSFGVADEHSNNIQLAEIQDQLMGVLLENEKLAAQLNHVKKNQVEALQHQLKTEKQRSRALDQQLRAPPPSVPVRRRKLAQRREEILYKSKSMIELPVDGQQISYTMDSQTGESMDDLEIAEESLLTPEFVRDHHRGSRREYFAKFPRRIQVWLNQKYEELKVDFSEVNTSPDVPKDPEGEPFNPFKLKRNLIRFGNVSDPITDFIRDCGSITRWENPAITLAIFITYMVIIYKGWFISVVLLMAISMFSFTYLRHRGWSFGNEVYPVTYSHPSEIEKNLGIRDQISILMLVGRRSQNDSGKGADLLEKLRNLLLWRDPEITKQLVTILCAIFVVSLIVSPIMIIQLAGFGAGIHIFIIQYLFYRFPRVKRKYDKVEEFLSRLKTDADFEKDLKNLKKEQKRLQHQTSEISNYTNDSSSSNSLGSLPSPSIDEQEATTPKTFSTMFSLPASEFPVSPWHNGRRCTLVNKDRSFGSGFKIGRMFLSNNYLCFERSRSLPDKNLVIPLETVKCITKAKLYHWLPGGGKALEVKLKNSGKEYLFVFQTHMLGSIVNRDEAYESILAIGSRNGFSWANPNSREN